ncbi:MAG: hypothetical protein RMX68_030815 [Aulosira sp. ZfuVER01]|nr:hypothetical protein [Aulosira sp. ZfuVER01]MDZ7996871.1 hypothetical protein [Aulosira sp. DedVER01a]MDZ8049997.1 hypothetical protein [Aulosira sp. ZfuCHP01]
MPLATLRVVEESTILAIADSVYKLFSPSQSTQDRRQRCPNLVKNHKSKRQ